SPTSTLFPYTTLFRSQCRSNQAAQDDNCHRVLDLVTRDVSCNHQRYQGQAGGQGRHQDRRKALHRTTQRELRTERLALVLLEVRSEEHTSELQSRFDL